MIRIVLFHSNSGFQIFTVPRLKEVWQQSQSRVKLSTTRSSEPLCSNQYSGSKILKTDPEFLKLTTPTPIPAKAPITATTATPITQGCWYHFTFPDFKLLYWFFAACLARSYCFFAFCLADKYFSLVGDGVELGPLLLATRGQYPAEAWFGRDWANWACWKPVWFIGCPNKICCPFDWK